MKKLYIILSIVISTLSYCTPDDNYYKDLIVGKDIIYPGKVDSLSFKGGENRFLLSAVLPKDSKVNKLIIYWNDKGDSILFDIDTKNMGLKQKFLVEDVKENIYTFEVYSYNLKGLKSVKSQISGRVYGESYKSSIVNRVISASDYNKTTKSLKLTWLPETNKTFLVTRVSYLDANNKTKKIILDKSTDQIVIDNYKEGSDVTYEAGFLPIATALDTIYSAPKVVFFK